MNKIDFNDFNLLEKLEEKRARRHLKLILLAESGDKKAKDNLRRHREEDRVIKLLARNSGYYWS